MMAKPMTPTTEPVIRLIIPGFIFMISLAILFALISLAATAKIADLNDKIYYHPFSVSNAALEANADIASMHHAMKEVVLTTTPEELENTISLVESLEQKIHRHFALIKERYLGDVQTVDEAFSTFVDWTGVCNEIIALKRGNQHQQAAFMTMANETHKIEHLLTKRMEVLINFARNKALEFKSNSQKTHKDSLTYLYISLAFMVLSSTIIAFLVVNRIRGAEQATKRSEKRYEDLFLNSEISIWSEDFSHVLQALTKLKMQGITDLKHHLNQNLSLAWQLAEMVSVNRVNTASLKMFGAESEADFIPKIDKTFGTGAIHVFIEELCAIWNKEKAFSSEANFNTLDGREITAIVSFHIPHKQSHFDNIPVSIIDITDRKKAEQRLKLASRVFNDTHEGILITDSDGIMIDVNPSFTKITGYSRDEAIGQNPRILNSGKQKSEYFAEMWRRINTMGLWRGEIWNRKKNGEVYAELLTISSLKNEQGDVDFYVGIFSDITHSKRQQDHIQKLAHYDVLTGLPNRTLLIDRFHQASAHAKRSNTQIALCFLDLDNFKPVNDIHGHAIGDKLLREVAHRLESVLREEDTISRLGGDEFALMLSDIKSTSEYYELLDRVIRSVSDNYLIDGKVINISASIGVSLYPKDTIEFDVLLRNADQAMYQAKQDGKNHYCFFDCEEAQKIARRNQQLQDIHHAFLDGELCLYYQPKVNMRTGDIIGIEALIRWRHPDKGLIPPIEFLPILEGTELEIQIGEWVIEQGMQQLEQLNAQDIEIEVSVNVSSHQFLNSAFLKNLNDALDRHHNIDSRYFQLEVLESSALGNLDQIHHIIKACRNDFGVSIALDDFGTGYSSLAHLGKLPADTIKIDQSFVRGALDNPNNFAIIDGVIGLSKSFNRHVIAEGVETTEHGLLLILLGCSNAQGYAIAHPMPSNELVNWIHSYRPNSEWLKCAQQDLSSQTKRIKQLQLILQHWLKHIQALWRDGSLIQTEMHQINSNFDRWLRRLRHQQVFKTQWLDQLQKAHHVTHIIAKELVDKYPAGSQPTKAELDKLYLAFNETLAILERYQ